MSLFEVGGLGENANLRDKGITGLGVQGERLEDRIQVTRDVVYREKDRFVRGYSWVRWVKRLIVPYRRGCTRGIRRDEMRVCAGNPGRGREGKGKEQINSGPSIKMTLN